MGSSMIIKLDTDAVEALVFGHKDDEEARLSISSSIVSQFVNRHLKGVVSDEIVKEAVAVLKKGIKQEVEETVGKTTMMGGAGLSVAMRQQIKAIIKSEMTSVIHQEAREALPEILKAVEPIVKSYVTPMVVKEIRAELQAAIKAAI